MSSITRKGRKLQEQILELIEKEVEPISTRQIALLFHCSWHTAYRYCLELLAKRKIDRFNNTALHLWIKPGRYIRQETFENSSPIESLQQSNKEFDNLLNAALEQELERQIQKLKEQLGVLEKKKLQDKKQVKEEGVLEHEK